MSEAKSWYLVSYDIRDPKRWRKGYKVLRGYGTRVQYSVFRCWLSVRRLEELRWELEKVLDAEDSLLFVPLCSACVARMVMRNRKDVWVVDDAPAKIV
ncbi:CRISPR-associated endonuclease Cas2 [Polyangium mundeleinium]|uniref:CRISPR-associated endoribonuclease Cas2 n=1 Tax=Polyangium mundeleinium TaxID=2995306 RepID=A0ABT5EF18_9BACT|nr:CRISPR-associated endonuclease Cas2 [Polyangium mundeleinium]MDC0739934.1 CRISPR-associated endonuclease Cas2 [Polyangium mundeleinium]